jgi:hypothetical protein
MDAPYSLHCGSLFGGEPCAIDNIAKSSRSLVGTGRRRVACRRSASCRIRASGCGPSATGADKSGRIPCQHRAPVALAPFVIRWGANASSDVLRGRLRCSICGHRGATIQRPSWAGTEIGEQLFRAVSLETADSPFVGKVRSQISHQRARAKRRVMAQSPALPACARLSRRPEC